MKFSSRDENRKEERRRAFYDFLKRIFTWNPEERMQPSQALQHPFITRTFFTGICEIQRSQSPIRKSGEYFIIPNTITRINDYSFVDFD